MSTTETKPNIDDELSHAGVKGMRWGIRRYQNADGSLTDLGKKRYSSEKKKLMDTARDDAYKKAVDQYLKNPRNAGDIAGAKAAGRAASKAATATTKVDQGKIFKDAVKDDLDATNTILREGGNAARTASNQVKNTRVKVKRMNLSEMTDKEMRDRIAREQLEAQYDSMFNPKRNRVESGKQTVASILDGLVTTAALTGSALSIALAVKQLKG